MTPSLRLTWLCPDDKGGGVVTVAQGCVRQAALAGHDATLLLALEPTGHAIAYGSAQLTSLGATPPYADIPARLIAWLKANPQDVLVLNGCEQADVAIPYLPAGLRVIYGVHDTAPRYYGMALHHEAALDGIVAVSNTVAARFRSRINDLRKLHVVPNGTEFPSRLEEVLARPRRDDFLFLGGDNPLKGAYDVLALWPSLVVSGFAGRLHWFGDIGNGFRSHIAASPAADRIELHGRQPRQRIFDVAGRSKVVLILSRVESFGMATVECMGMGCLAVAWDIETGTREIVADGEGVFAPLGDYGRLADGILELISDHEARYRGSMMRIRSRFDDHTMWAHYETIISEMHGRSVSVRPLCNQPPPSYRPPTRLFQHLPKRLRERIQGFAGRSPRLGYLLRDFRGR